MRITLTQEELLGLINNYFKTEPKVDRVLIEVETENRLKDIFSISENDWFVGSFIEEEIKNKDRR